MLPIILGLNTILNGLNIIIIPTDLGPGTTEAIIPIILGLNTITVPTDRGPGTTEAILPIIPGLAKILNGLNTIIIAMDLGLGTTEAIIPIILGLTILNGLNIIIIAIIQMDHGLGTIELTTHLHRLFLCKIILRKWNISKNFKNKFFRCPDAGCAECSLGRLNPY